ncbi:hypothetical protein PS3A_39720 [Pseudomonas sp. 3A(2025)]
MNPATLAALTTLLWPEEQAPEDDQVYWLLDGARDPDIVKRIHATGFTAACLYSGELTPRLTAAAPWLVQLKAQSPATLELLAQGWGQAWGIFIKTSGSLPMAQLRLHLKKFLRVRTEDKTTLMFRYYDPRVLSVFLPSCTDEEFFRLLGPAQAFISELDEGRQWQQFEREGPVMKVTSGPINRAGSER